MFPRILQRYGRRNHALGQRLGLVVLLLALATAALQAQVISGTVQDPTGAVIPGARIEIGGGDLTQAIVLTSDETGKFSSPELKSGTYSLRISRDGFEVQIQTLDLHAAVELQIQLAIAREKVSISVPGKHMEFANSDPLYRRLRDDSLGESFRFDNYTLVSDVATFHFLKGTMTFLAPVDGRVTGAIFIGEGHFSLAPFTVLDAQELKRRTGNEEFEEDFSEAVFRFAGQFNVSFVHGVGEKVATPVEAGDVFNHWKEEMRKRREQPLGFTEYLLHGEGMDNVDADLLATYYNDKHPPFMNAYIHGKKHKKLLFLLRARVGAIPQLDSPEEVALINYNPEGMDDGIWYLEHLKSEYTKGMASSSEDRRLFATDAYKIETIIAKNQHLFSTATITFEPLIAGERVLKFDLLPNLRVSRVVDRDGQDLYFIQEGRKEDGSFYVILPAAPAAGKQASVTVQFAGDKVLEDAGGGSFYVGARTSWYPNLNGFGEHALFDLTFKVPHRYKVISVGELQSESTEGDFAVSHWVTPIPVAVAGFNYGEYKRMDLADDKDGYKLSGYYLSELPDNLRGYRALQSMAPGAMTKYALEQTRAQLQLCTYYFGKIPYNEIHITEQPNFNFGQSWPNLVYLPISAYTDSTQRWMLFGTISSKFTGFVEEVTPHEVSHQWWGHAVGWASYHDQWLSEGFAEFSAGLFLQQAVGGNWRKDYVEFWERLRKRILEKNEYGIAPNDTGPLWMGLRLTSPHSLSAYQNVTYPKGAYVLQMLRSVMYDPENKDKNFIDMMHDFVGSHQDRPASTESFKAVVERHMTKMMDLEHNGRMDWFFNEWVYGTKIPRYKFEYQISPAENGKVKVHITVTQSEVDDHFVMPVPVFADFGKGTFRLGEITLVGNTTRSGELLLPSPPKKVELNAFKEILERDR